MAEQKNVGKPSQDYVPIKEIRSSVVVLKDNSLRAVLLASSLNFALKSEEEQQAIIAQFQNFLNSLDFSLQIGVQSRGLDIRPYIALLEDRFQAQTIELMKIQTQEYIGFVKGFVDTVNIMSKNFFVVVPYSGSPLSTKKGLKGLFPGGSSTASVDQEVFEEKRTQLEQRITIVTQGLSRAGIRLARLGTEELVELYYKTFNPGELGKPLPAGMGDEKK